MKFSAEDIGKKVLVADNQDTKAVYPFKTGVLCVESHTAIGEEWIGIATQDGIHDCGGNCGEGKGVWVYAEDFEIF